jgi:23S rRNA (adenine2503-C2)-methyltransferase
MQPTPPSAAGAKPLVYGLTLDELSAEFAGMGEPTYRARQLWQWLYVKRVGDWPACHNLSLNLRERLAARFTLRPLALRAVTGPLGATRKLLLELTDGECVESVLIPGGGQPPAGAEPGAEASRERRTVCVSSQVGCRFHCAFCASGQAGFVRDLETGEIVAQAMAAHEVWGQAPTHVVFMGIGEPFDNYDRVLKAVRILNDGDGLNLGARRITISTCGVVPGIERLATEGIQVELSISLHAPDDDLRSRLMPVNTKYPLDPLLGACRAYAETTGRLVTFEYALIRDVNDTRRHAAALVARLANWPCRVNLIPLSAVAEFEALASTPDRARAFTDTLTAAGINTTLRASKGAALQAACGQLRASHRQTGATEAESPGMEE